VLVSIATSSTSSKVSRRGRDDIMKYSSVVFWLMLSVAVARLTNTCSAATCSCIRRDKCRLTYIYRYRNRTKEEVAKIQ
jgi:hypothetical protein